MAKIITTLEMVGEYWREFHPNHCPVKLRDGDGKSVGACWYYLRDGRCETHGSIYEPKEEAQEHGKKHFIVRFLSWLQRKGTR